MSASGVKKSGLAATADVDDLLGPDSSGHSHHNSAKSCCTKDGKAKPCARKGKRQRSKLAQWMPVILISLAILIDYTLCVRTLVPWVLTATSFGEYYVWALNAGLFMCIYSYYVVLTTPPGYVEKGWKPLPGEKLPNPLVENEELGFCDICETLKPPRSHHCSVCNRCVHRMDHHCPWVGGCVGLQNMKTFILFLFYASSAIAIVGLMLMYRLADVILHVPYGHWCEEADCVSYGVMGTMSTGLFISTVTLFCMAIGGVVKNVNNVEVLILNNASHMQSVNLVWAWPYDVGERRNMKQIFGQRIWTWPFPSAGGGDPFDTPLNQAYLRMRHAERLQRENDTLTANMVSEIV